MRIPKILCTLSVITMLCGVANAAPEQASPPPPARPLVNTTWEMTPIDNMLTPQQVEFLNLYMSYPDSREMSKLSRNVKENLPLYIALHERQLDPKALIHFRVTQLLNVGMTFNDIANLQEIMAGLREGRQPDPKQRELLRNFIADVRKNQRISLNTWFRPLFSYVANSPGEFTPRETNTLRDALLNSVGLTPRELKGLYDFADQKSNTPVFDEKEVGPANKLILLAHLQGVELLNPKEISYLRFAIDQNRATFGPEKVEAFNRAVDTSRAVEQYTYEAFQANNPGRGSPQEIGYPQEQYLEQQRQIQAAQSRQQQMPRQPLSAEEAAAQRRHLEAQQQAQYFDPRQVQSVHDQRYFQQQQQQAAQMQAYQLQAQQAVQEQAYRQRAAQQAYLQQMQQEAAARGAQQ